MKVLFIVTKRAGEMETVLKEGFKGCAIPAKGLLRKSRREQMVLPFFLAAGAMLLSMILLRHHPRVIVGTGGYASFMPLLLGILWGIPTVISEQDSHPGLTTRLLSRFVTEVHLAHESAKGALRARNLFITGNPVRDSILEGTREQALKHFKLEKGKKTIFIVGGSHGARSINTAFLDVMKKHSFPGIQFILATGRSDYHWVSESLHESKCSVRVLPYIERMNLAYAASDLMFSRAGALTLAELMVRGVPSILIPFPFATGGHQEENARHLEKLGAAVVLLDHELEHGRIIALIENLIYDEKRLLAMRNRAKMLGKPDAAPKLAQRIVALAQGGPCVS